MALKFTSACLLQADRIYYAVALLHESRRDPTASGSFYPDPGLSQHVLAEPLDFCFKLSAGMLLLSQSRLAEMGRIDLTHRQEEGGSFRDIMELSGMSGI